MLLTHPLRELFQMSCCVALSALSSGCAAESFPALIDHAHILGPAALTAPATTSSLLPEIESLCHVALFQTPLSDEITPLSSLPFQCECGTPCMELIFTDCERGQSRDRPTFKALMQSLKPVRTSVDPREVNAAEMTHPLHDSDGSGM